MYIRHNTDTTHTMYTRHDTDTTHTPCTSDTHIHQTGYRHRTHTMYTIDTMYIRYNRHHTNHVHQTQYRHCTHTMYTRHHTDTTHTRCTPDMIQTPHTHHVHHRHHVYQTQYRHHTHTHTHPVHQTIQIPHTHTCHTQPHTPHTCLSSSTSLHLGAALPHQSLPSYTRPAQLPMISAGVWPFSKAHSWAPGASAIRVTGPAGAEAALTSPSSSFLLSSLNLQTPCRA